MANIIVLCFLFTFLLNQLEAHVYLPLSRDSDSLQFVTTIQIGKSSLPSRLVLDLSAPFLFTDQPSSSIPISKCSIQCFKAKPYVDDPNGSSSCFDHNRGIASQGICMVSAVNTFTGSEAKGELVEDQLEVGSISGATVKLNNFIFSIGPSLLLTGLASGANGVLGLGRGNIGVLSQISNAVSSQRKFFLCLSSSTGFLLFGDGGINPIFPSKFSNDLAYTPLINTEREGDYLIEVKSIRINAEKVAIGSEVARISTSVPYTVLSSAAYESVTRAYESAAIAMNMRRVESGYPFGLCFSSEGGEEWPWMDLVLQSEMVKWRIEGKNLMKRVGDRRCLGIVDGGSKMDVGMVVGGMQLVDNLLEFNVGTNMLGFGKQSSCLGVFPRFITDL